MSQIDDPEKTHCDAVLPSGQDGLCPECRNELPELAGNGKDSCNTVTKCDRCGVEIPAGEEYLAFDELSPHATGMLLWTLCRTCSQPAPLGRIIVYFLLLMGLMGLLSVLKAVFSW